MSENRRYLLEKRNSGFNNPNVNNNNNNINGGSYESIRLSNISADSDNSTFSNNRNSFYSNRLPSVIFTGPNSLYNRRVRKVDFAHDIGIGETSKLRTLDIGYITRGKSGTLMNSRKDIPGEIGWSYLFFQNVYPTSLMYQLQRPNSTYIPR